MLSESKYILALLGLNVAINLIFLYRYSTLEYNIEVDTDIIVRKVIGLEAKINKLMQNETMPQ